MNGTAARFGPALRRWRFPDLEPKPDAGEMTAPIATEAPLATHAAAEVAAPSAADDWAEERQHAAAAEMARGYDAGLARGIADGRQQGHAEGFASGETAGRQSLAAEARRIATLVECLAAPMPTVERAVEDALIGLALELARFVIGGEITRSRDSLVRVIREALATAPVRVDGLRIALNPADLALVRSLAPEVESGGAVLVGDQAVETGGCLILVEEGDGPVKDRRWQPRPPSTVPQIDLSLAARWRSAMLALFEGEGT
jgi:flagellar assembly protein FliH